LQHFHYNNKNIIDIWNFVKAWFSAKLFCAGVSKVRHNIRWGFFNFNLFKDLRDLIGGFFANLEA